MWAVAGDAVGMVPSAGSDAPSGSARSAALSCQHSRSRTVSDRSIRGWSWICYRAVRTPCAPRPSFEAFGRHTHRTCGMEDAAYQRDQPSLPHHPDRGSVAMGSIGSRRRRTRDGAAAAVASVIVTTWTGDCDRSVAAAAAVAVHPPK